MRDRYVLVIDDDEGIRELVVTVLGEAGLPAVAVADTADGLAACRRAPPGLVLLDPMETPLSDGEFLRAYRALPGPRAPVLLFTAQSRPEAHAAAIGADGVLAKPFDLDDFLERVRSALGAP